MPPGKKVDLASGRRVVDPYYKSKEQYQELLNLHMEKLSSLQQLHYASNRYALLLIFQGMDGAGKDGAIRHVMSGVNPEGCEVFSFKQPSAEELTTIFSGAPPAAFPSAGGSASSTALITRRCWSFACIRRFFAARASPKSCVTRKTSGRRRYRSIEDLEKHLHRNGTRDHQNISAPVLRGTAKAIPRAHR